MKTNEKYEKIILKNFQKQVKFCVKIWEHSCENC